MSLEAAILGFLNERPRSGYDLKTRCFDHQAKPFWTADQAQIYRTLDRLQTSGLVSSTRKRQTGRPDRRIYALTDAGRQHLTSWLATDQSLPVPRDSFLLQLYFAAALDEPEIVLILEARRRAHQMRLETLRAEAAEVARAETPSARDIALRGAAYDGAIAQERASIDWLDDIVDAVKAGQLPTSGEGPGQQHLFGASSVQA